MNMKFVVHRLGLLILALSGVIALHAGITLIRWQFMGLTEEQDTTAALAVSAVCCGALGTLIWLTSKSKATRLERREAVVLVSLSWIIGAAVCAVPYFVWAMISDNDHAARVAMESPVNVYFESLSGLTTTGATVLTELSTIPKGLLLWRATTHWLGGLGIVVLFVAVLPGIGIGGRRLFSFEAPGPDKSGLHPHIRETARTLFVIYSVLTAVLAVGLMLSGLSPMDAVCHSFATLATGGFSTDDASVAQYNSGAAMMLIIVFMFFAGMNFNLFYHISKGKWKKVIQDTEFRAYLGIVVVAATVVAFSLVGQTFNLTNGREITNASPGDAALQSMFTCISIQTTTGFCTADFDQWPTLAKSILIALTFIGGCAGSTGGGIKVIRIWIVFRTMFSEVDRVVRPNVIRPLRTGEGGVVDQDMRLAVISYAMGVVLLFAAGTITIMLLEPSVGIQTGATASLATLCTTGPGLARVGATQNYAFFGDASKIVMCVLMLLGRLEVFAIACLFSPHFWRNS
ncbi:MAG: TrkH family potassium uptake protein [Phycisphaeraceae bacterium]|nr:TrkH family potassium uptake protein [Phycisphaerales bacterium]MCB9861339.1 TrkH family potassium uptake protein [Phycisphaeraceae bacterium]